MLKKIKLPSAMRIPEGEEIFPHDRLVKLLIPLIIEQTLAVTIGMADTVMVSSVGEAAISGISLVDQINILLIQVFSALAAGGAVVTAQYLGRHDKEHAASAAKQLLWLCTGMAVLIGALSLIFDRSILSAVYGRLEDDVMENAVIYYFITASSFPALAIYSAGAALFRSMGNSRISMYTSALMNVINIGGNAALIYGFKLGVAGAALATLASRIVGAAIMLYLICSHRNVTENEIRVEGLARPGFSAPIVRSILKIGVPTGLESGMFQIGKLLVANIITIFGTASIAANAVCNTLAGFAIIPGNALGLAMVTVIGQCVGAKDYRQASAYTYRLMGYIYLFGGMTNLLIFLLSSQMVGFFNISEEAYGYAVQMIRLYTIVAAVFHPVSFSLPNALRAAGDAKLTMITSGLSMWIFRIGFSYILALGLNLGVQGVWYAMYIDWVVRSIVFVIRFLGGKWKKIKVID